MFPMQESLPSNQPGRDSTRSGMSCRHALACKADRLVVAEGAARTTAQNPVAPTSKKSRAPCFDSVEHTLDRLRRLVDGGGLGDSCLHHGHHNYRPAVGASS